MQYASTNTTTNMESPKFWKWIDASVAYRLDWIAQLEAIAQATGNAPLKDIIAFDDWLQNCISTTYKKTKDPALDAFHEVNGSINSLECFIILLGNSMYERIINDASLLNTPDYLKQYEAVCDVICNLVDTPDYIFYWRTGKQMKDYRNNPKVLSELQKEVNKNPDKRYY